METTRKVIKLELSEKEQRIAALEARLRIEELAFRCLAVAAPYLNDEDKFGWKAGDVIKFLRSEIDPSFLTGRKIQISRQTPDAKYPTKEDYEKLDWSLPMAEPNVSLAKLVKHWHSMGQLLHRDLREIQFDVEKSRTSIEAANKFCDAAPVEALVVVANIQPEEFICSEGHSTKRNAARLKVHQIIPCVNPKCKCVFVVERSEPLVLKEVRLEIKCGVCNSANHYPIKDLINLSYWEIATVACLNENCDNQMQVRWLLSQSNTNQA